MSKKKDSEQYMRDLDQWQKEMYSPTAGIRSNWLIMGKRSKKVGYFMLIWGLVLLFFGIFIFTTTGMAMPSIIAVVFGIIISCAGFNTIRKIKHKQS